jgi:hypothetical protein
MIKQIGLGALLALAPTLALAQSSAQPLGGATPGGAMLQSNRSPVTIKASAGTLYSLSGFGVGSAPAYVKFYDNASACTGTIVWRLGIPANGTAANGDGSNMPFPPMGLAFANGITYCPTTDISNSNAGVLPTGTFFMNYAWK